MPLAAGFFDAVGKFFSSIASVSWGPLLLGMLFFGCDLTLRSRAFFHALRAAYPEARISWRRIWGAYVAGAGVNGVLPARGGDVIKLFLTHGSVEGASYPAVGATFLVEVIFNSTIAIPVLIFAFTQGVFPKPPDFSKLKAFDLAFLASHPRFTLFLLTAIAFLILLGFALLSRRVKLFWASVRQGLTILRDRRRYLREVWLVQFAGWLFRGAAFWMLLDAFHIGGSVRNTLLVFGATAVASIVPFTPGGAGVQQAFLVSIFGSGAVAYSVGQQIALAAFSLALGFFSIVVIFKFRSFKEVIHAGRQSRAAAAEAAR
ncbi:MAG: flippase-like protein [Solirubrobacteraceae bacterium]|nr:flippase-like protein [Solirubrobacteraceae bacterium]